MNEVVIHVRSENEVQAGFTEARKVIDDFGKETVTKSDKVGSDSGKKLSTSLEREVKKGGKDAGEGFIQSFGTEATKTFSAVSDGIVPLMVGMGVVASPLIASTLAAAVVGGAGIGGIIGGVMLAKDDPRVAATASALGTNITSRLKVDAGVFVAPIIQGLGVASSAFDRIEPHIQHIFSNSSKFLAPLIQGAAGAGISIAAGLDSAVSKAGPVFDALGRSVESIGGDVGHFFSDMGDHATEGAMAIDQLTYAIGNTVKVTDGLVGAGAKVEDYSNKLDQYIDKGRYWVEDSSGLSKDLSALGISLDLTADGYKKGSAQADAYRRYTEGVASAQDLVLLKGNSLVNQQQVQVAEQSVANATTLEASQAQQEQAAAVAATTKALNDQVNALNDSVDVNLDMFKSVTEIASAEKTLYSDVKKSGAGLDENTAKGQANRKALESLGEKLQNNTEDYLKLHGAGLAADQVMAKNRDTFLKAATAASGSAAAARKLTNAIFGIPDKKTVKLLADAANAKYEVQHLKDLLAGVQSKTVRVNVIVAQSQLNKVNNTLNRLGGEGYAHGGIKGAATGGNQNGLTWVGENGPELVNLPSGSSVRTNADSQRAVSGGGGSNQPIYIQIDGKTVFKAMLPHGQAMNRKTYANNAQGMWAG